MATTRVAQSHDMTHPSWWRLWFGQKRWCPETDQTVAQLRLETSRARARAAWLREVKVMSNENIDVLKRLT